MHLTTRVSKVFRRVGCVLRALRTGCPVVAWEDGLRATIWLRLTLSAAAMHYRLGLHRQRALSGANLSTSIVIPVFPRPSLMKLPRVEVTRLDMSIVALTCALMPLALLLAGAIAIALR